MTRIEEYRRKLRSLDDWIPYLRRQSGLPGPRGNLELAQTVAELASAPQIETFLSTPIDSAPENSPGVFVVFCGVAALGHLAACGDTRQLARLRTYASDARWRVREAVAIALQYLGDADMPALLRAMKSWSAGTWYEKRAVAAALAEPRLLKSEKVNLRVLKLLDAITADIERWADPRDEGFKACRQTLGYAWSVVVAAGPSAGKALMGRWLRCADPNVRWVMRENLKKSRLSRLDPAWVRAGMDLLKG